MRWSVLSAGVGAIALMMVGCASEPEVTAPSPLPVPSPTAQKPAVTAQQPFGTKPLVAQKLPQPTTVPGLIQSTNRDERARQVQSAIDAQRGKKDPFAGLQPAIPRIQTTANRTQVPTVSRLPANSRPNSATASPTASRPTSPFPPLASPTPTKQSPAKEPTIAALPPLPSTNLANSVQVTGVVQAGGVAQAIVKAPNEETSRYVRVGQRLSNGQVLVKRIDMSGGGDPVVILEENGIEVAKVVGEPVPQQKPGGAA